MPRGNHKWTGKGIQNRKKTTGKTTVSCKFRYFKSAERQGKSKASGFFTDDYFAEDTTLAGFLRRVRNRGRFPGGGGQARA
jgi:hypothetical protein